MTPLQEFKAGVKKQYKKEVIEGPDMDIRIHHRGLWSVVFIVLIVFSLAHGFERVDCALRIQKACEVIQKGYK